MSDLTNHLNSSASNTSNTTGQHAISPPANPPITSSTQPNHSASNISTHPSNRELVNDDDQAQITTPTDNTINSDHQTGDNAPNDPNDTQPSADMTVELTDDQAVRDFHDAFHTAPQRSGVPYTLASSIAPRLTAMDRQELGLPPGTSQSESTFNTNQSTSSEPNGFDLFETPSSRIPPAAVRNTPATLGMSQGDDFSSSGTLSFGPPQANSSRSLGASQASDFTSFGFHASELASYPMRRSAPPNGTAALPTHPLREASDTATMFDSTHPSTERSSNSNPLPPYTLAFLSVRGGPAQDNGDSPPNLTTNNLDTIDHAVIDSETGCTHGQAEYSNGGVIGSGNGRAQVGRNTLMDDVPSVSVSDLRLGPVGRETLAALALSSQYPEDEPSRAAPDDATTAGTSATPVRRRGLGPRLGNEHADHGDDRVLARPNTPTHPQTTDTMPPFGLTSHHPDRRTGSAHSSHGNMLDGHVRDSTPTDEERPTHLSDYLTQMPLSAEVREAWDSAFTAAPENAMQDQRHPDYAQRNVNRVTTAASLDDYTEELSTEERERWTRAMAATLADGNTSPNSPPNSSNLSSR